MYEVYGYDESTIDGLLARLDALFNVITAEPQVEADVRQALLDLITAQLDALPDEQKAGIDDVEATVTMLAEQSLPSYNGPWWAHFLAYNPADDWALVEVPVLALFGALDVQVDADQNLTALEQIVSADLLTTELFPTANHLFQDAITGSIDEYGSLGDEFLPELLPLIREWILEQTAA